MRNTMQAIGRVLGSLIGADEIVLIAGLCLLCVGLWPVVGRAALIAPGAVFVWLAMPSRAPFLRDTTIGAVPQRRQKVRQ